jgi:hypothetical protein
MRIGRHDSQQNNKTYATLSINYNQNLALLLFRCAEGHGVETRATGEHQLMGKG